MKCMNKTALLFLGLLNTSLIAQEAAAPAASSLPAAAPIDPDLPQPFDPRSLSSLLQSPPFTRTVNLSDSLILTGMAYVDKKPVASLLDSETKKTYVVSEEPNALGWRIAEATPASKLARAQLKLQIGTEVVTIRYNQEGITDTMKDGKPAPFSTSRGNRDDRGPGEGDKGYKRSMRGPSEEDRKRYESLSEEAKEKVRNMFRDPGLRDKMMSMSDDDRRNYIRSQVDKIESDDKKSRK
jgi:hypothetical protein